jgi:hypothetical protein
MEAIRAGKPYGADGTTLLSAQQLAAAQIAGRAEQVMDDDLGTQE